MRRSIHIDAFYRYLCRQLFPRTPQVLIIKPYVRPIFISNVRLSSTSSSPSSSVTTDSPPSFIYSASYHSPLKPLAISEQPPSEPRPNFARESKSEPEPEPSTTPTYGPIAPLDYLSSLARRRRYPDVFNTAAVCLATGSLKPTLELYEILITSCAWGPGCTLQARAFIYFAELKKHGLQPNAKIYNGILRLLSKSPDYIRRAEVLDEMQQRWFTLADEAWAWVVIGHARHGQPEMALDMVVQREVRGSEVPRIAYRDLATGLIAFGEVDEALRILKTVEGGLEPLAEAGWQGVVTPDQRKKMWWDLLATAARNMHHEATAYIWNNKVTSCDIKLPLLTPNEGLRMLVLNCATRNGDPALAESVIDLHTREGSKLKEHHYAALIEAYAAVNPPNTSQTFRLLATMRRQKVPPNPNTTRAAIPYLAASRKTVDDAAADLRNLVENADLSSVELVMSSYVALNDTQSAYNLYRSLPSLLSHATTGTPTRPTTNTINILLSGYAKEGQKPLCMYLVAEMREMKIAPDRATYESLVRVCINSKSDGDYFDLFLYLEEMKAAGYRLSRGGYVGIVLRCAESGDLDRADMVMEEMERVGWDAKTARDALYQRWKVKS